MSSLVDQIMVIRVINKQLRILLICHTLVSPQKVQEQWMNFIHEILKR